MQRCTIATNLEFLRQQPGHDGLARAGVIGKKIPKRLAGQHLLVDRRDLMRERFDQRGVDGEQRVEEVGQPDALGLGDEAEHPPVAIEAPRTTGRYHFQGGFSVAVDQFVPQTPGGVLVGKLDGGACRSTSRPRQ